MILVMKESTGYRWVDSVYEKKKIIKHRHKGRGDIYMPKLTKAEYTKFLIDSLVNDYYDGDCNLLIQDIHKR